MAARRISVLLLQIRQHPIEHLGINRSTCVVIEIYLSHAHSTTNRVTKAARPSRSFMQIQMNSASRFLSRQDERSCQIGLEQVFEQIQHPDYHACSHKGRNS